MTTKYQNDTMLDQALNWVATNGKKMYVTTASIDSGSSPSYFKITSSAALTGAISMSSSASFTVANGSSSGRKTTVSAKSSIAVTGSGTAARICLVNSSGSTVTYITTCTSQVLTSGNTVDVPSWKIELADAA